MHESELQLLESSINVWCTFLEKNGYDNFSKFLKNSFQSLVDCFDGSARERYEGLLDFQDKFKGGMGSINDLSIDDSHLRENVETERDLLIKKYYKILHSHK